MFYILATTSCGSALNRQRRHLFALSTEVLYQKALDSLKLIHSAGVLHKDIRLANILCDSKTQKIYWIDFAFSKTSSNQKEFEEERNELKLIFSSSRKRKDHKC